MQYHSLWGFLSLPFSAANNDVGVGFSSFIAATTIIFIAIDFCLTREYVGGQAMQKDCNYILCVSIYLRCGM